MSLSRREWLKTGTLAGAASLAGGTSDLARADGPPAADASQPRELPFRMIVESLPHPYWYADPAHGNPGAPRAFWDRAAWIQRFQRLRDGDYNAVMYWCDPWQVYQWQAWLIRHRKNPEARELPEKKQDALIEQVGWVFRKAQEMGLKNFLISMNVITTPAFARARGLDKKMPESESVDWRHNSETGGLPMFHFGVRNELTRDFTINAIRELFQTYPQLDGLLLEMGEALPGRRSTWFKEAIVPGLKLCGRKPLMIVNNWMMPLDDFLQDIAPREVYDNTWLAIEHNGEVICDRRPDPISLRWPEQSGLPTIVMYVGHNISEMPFNSPKFAHDLIHHTRRIDHSQGFHSYQMDSLSNPRQDLFSRALGYYGRHDQPYSDEPWVAILKERFGDEEAARHFLKAFNISGEITPAVNVIAWQPHDGHCPNQLILKYWHWSDQDIRYTYFSAPPQGATLLPVKHYARVVAEFGDNYRQNNGSDWARYKDPRKLPIRHGHPGAQELIWGHIDYQVTPEAHMRKIRKMGEDCAGAAERGLKTVKKNKEQAETLFQYMKAYELLTAYYEHKVLTAVSALIYFHSTRATGDDGARPRPEEKLRAEKLADETVELYKRAANYIYEKIDKRSGNIKGRWSDGERDLPGLIEAEKSDRQQIPQLFRWPS
jgi:hypothetical protein